MGLFSNIERDDQGPARRSASQYAYLDRSARPEAYKVRSLIENWLDNYPIESRTKLLGDLRSKNDIQHLAGFFELLIHQMYFQTNAQILENLDPSCVSQAAKAGHWDQYRLDIEIEGLHLQLDPMPKRSPCRTDRLIGAELPPARYVSTSEVVRDRIIDKARRYGTLGKPYIIAVNVFGLAPDRDDVLSALFGSQAAEISWDAEGPRVAKMVRLPDGALYDSRGPRYTRVSGVLWTRGLTPWSIASRKLELVCNPFAAHPLTDLGLPLPALIPGARQFEERSGVSVGEMLGLSAGWPES
jgi:hypothetical protein